MGELKEIDLPAGSTVTSFPVTEEMEALKRSFLEEQQQKSSKYWRSSIGDSTQL